jgi:hypothetical protein
MGALRDFRASSLEEVKQAIEQTNGIDVREIETLSMENAYALGYIPSTRMVEYFTFLNDVEEGIFEMKGNYEEKLYSPKET